MCPECEGIGGFPGFDVDGSERLNKCPMCDGFREVSEAVARDWHAEVLACGNTPTLSPYGDLLNGGKR